MKTTTPDTRSFRVSLDTANLSAFREAMTSAGYESEDTGERITTDAGPNGEAILVVRVPRAACVTRSERIAALLRP